MLSESHFCSLCLQFIMLKMSWPNSDFNGVCLTPSSIVLINAQVRVNIDVLVAKVRLNEGFNGAVTLKGLNNIDNLSFLSGTES